LTLHGPGVEVDQQVDRAAALAILRVALGDPDVKSDPGESKAGAECAGKRRPRLSLREYVDAVDARSNPEKITAFGAYLRDQQEKDDFSRDDIKGCFRSAGESLPANFPRDFNAAIQNGWISEDHEKSGRYYVTRKGDEVTKSKAGGVA
jgi:hypothetical protein